MTNPCLDSDAFAPACFPRTGCAPAQDKVTVSFGNEGIDPHYVMNDVSLAHLFGVTDILNNAYLTQNVTGGHMDDSYYIPASSSSVQPGGTVTTDYLKHYQCYNEAYFFNAEGWNQVKNISVEATGKHSIYAEANHFVHVDMDFACVKNDVRLEITDAKRGNYATGKGDDIIHITSATNDHEPDPDGWNDVHKIRTGDGCDKVIISQGDDSLIGHSQVTYVDGHLTQVEALLGGGKDYFSGIDAMSSDTVHGGNGDDTILGGAGNDCLYGDNGCDVIWGGTDDGQISAVGAGEYSLSKDGDVLSGGNGPDDFFYKTGDGFDRVVDFGHQDDLHLVLGGGDTYSTEAATVHTSGGDLSGTMVLVNGEAAVFLQDFHGTADIIA